MLFRESRHPVRVPQSGSLPHQSFANKSFSQPYEPFDEKEVYRTVFGNTLPVCVSLGRALLNEETLP